LGDVEDFFACEKVVEEGGYIVGRGPLFLRVIDKESATQVLGCRKGKEAPVKDRCRLGSYQALVEVFDAFAHNLPLIPGVFHPT